MTEKRFTINEVSVLSDSQVLKILNKLADENEQLKKRCKQLEAMLYIQSELKGDVE